MSLCRNLIPATYTVLNLDIWCINLQIAVSDGILWTPIPLFVEHPVQKVCCHPDYILLQHTFNFP